MPWVKLDDHFNEHPKLAQVGPLGLALWVCGLAYCNRNLTDGFIPFRVAHSLLSFEGIGVFNGTQGEDVTGEMVASMLVVAGLWQQDGRDYRVHDYLDYQPSRAEVLAARGIAKRRFAMNSDPNLRVAVRARDGDYCRYCGRLVNWQDRKSDAGGTYDHVVPLSQGGHEGADNIVSCCRACNTKKGARTPEEAGMALLPSGSRRNLDGIKTESKRNLDGIQTESSSILDTPVPVPVPVPVSDPAPENGRGQASPAQRKRREPAPKTPPPPAVETFREVMHRYPDKAQFAIIAGTIGDTDDALAFWRAVLTKWRDRGYNRANLEDMLHCFTDRHLPGRRNATGPDEETYGDAARRLGYTT